MSFGLLLVQERTVAHLGSGHTEAQQIQHGTSKTGSSTLKFSWFRARELGSMLLKIALALGLKLGESTVEACGFVVCSAVLPTLPRFAGFHAIFRFNTEWPRTAAHACASLKPTIYEP